MWKDSLRVIGVEESVFVNRMMKYEDIPRKDVMSSFCNRNKHFLGKVLYVNETGVNGKAG